MLSRPLSLLLLALGIAAGGRPLAAQDPITANSRMASRADLERLQASYELLAASTAYSLIKRKRKKITVDSKSA